LLLVPLGKIDSIEAAARQDRELTTWGA